MFSPGSAPFQPANLSNFKELSFWARGEGRTYQVLVWSLSKGFIPITKTFDAGPDWQRYSFAIQSFDGIDGRDLTGLFFGRSPELGRFWLEIDHVEFR